MSATYCCLAFRIFHPSISAEDICCKLGLVAYHKWTVGEPKQSIKGKPLKGVNKSSFCVFHFVPSKHIGLEEWVYITLDKLTSYKRYLDNLRKTGGRMEYCIVMFTDEVSGMTFEPDLLLKMTELNIALIIDIYPKPSTYAFHKLPEWYFKVSA